MQSIYNYIHFYTTCFFAMRAPVSAVNICFAPFPISSIIASHRTPSDLQTECNIRPRDHSFDEESYRMLISPV